MARFLFAQRRCLLPLLVILAAACGCQSRPSIVVDASAWLHASGAGSHVASTESANAVQAPVDRSVSADNRGRRGAADGSRHVKLAGYRDGALDGRQAAAYQRRGTGNDALAGGSTSLSMSLASMQDSQDAEEDKAATASPHPEDVAVHKGNSLAEINNKLNNPGADLAQLQFKVNWNQFQGSLGSGGEGASSQNEVSLDLQPVFPFKLSDGATLIIRPTIPITWSPYYDERSNVFDNQFGLGDAQLVGFYSRTDMKKGRMWGIGVTTQFPTHTDDVLGNDAFMVGPAGFFGFLGKWGSAGLFPQHWWNIGGGDGYTSLTALEAWYWFNIGKGWQIGGSPVITYNWANDDSDNNLTVPVNLGFARTIMAGKLPMKLKLEGIYYTVQPDEFGPQWGLQLTITPVIPNPFEKHGA